MTSISKNVYIDKWYNIVNKYNNKYHRTIKMKAVDAKPSMYCEFNIENSKVLNLKLVIMLEYQNIKIFLQNAMLQIGPKKFLWLKN